MAAFTAKDVQALREKTGVGMMECKKALVDAEGDMDKAVEILKEKGLATQQKKSSRVAAEGVVVAYNDKENKIGVLVEVNCETDFVAKNPDFVALAKKIAQTVAEKNPADVDALLKETLTGADCTVEEAVQELFLAIRENMKVRRFARVDGIVETYIHAGGSVGVMVQFETDDATAAKDEFVAMAKNIAMQVAAMSPEYLSESDITEDELAKMKNITIESALNKPDSLPKPILMQVFQKVLADNLWSEEDVAAYNEQKNNKFLFNFLSKEAVAKLAEVAVSLKDAFVGNVIFRNILTVEAPSTRAASYRSAGMFIRIPDVISIVYGMPTHMLTRRRPKAVSRSRSRKSACSIRRSSVPISMKAMSAVTWRALRRASAQTSRSPASPASSAAKASRRRPTTLRLKSRAW